VSLPHPGPGGQVCNRTLRVIRSLDQVIEWRGKPAAIRCDNGPEYISGALLGWAEKLCIKIDFIQPGKPQQNAYVERFNRTVRYEWLAQYELTRWPICRTTQRVGCGPIITTAPTWPWAVSPQNSGWPWPRSSTSGSHGKWEDYHADLTLLELRRAITARLSAPSQDPSGCPHRHRALVPIKPNLPTWCSLSYGLLFDSRPHDYGRHVSCK
jgi:transposase InsO family protein